MGFIGVQPTSAPLTSSDITDGIVTTAKIADDAITGAKIENNPTIAGNLIVSGTSTLADNLVFSGSGKGVHLGVTTATASNLQDDYEEGSYTPDFYHVSSDNSTWSTKTGTYVKVGKQVTAWGVCDVGNSGTAGSSLLVTLPFTASGVNIMCGGSVVYNGTSHGDTLGLQLYNSAIARIYCPSAYHTNQVTYIGFCVTFTVA